VFVSFRHCRHFDLSEILEADRWPEVELVESLFDLSREFGLLCSCVVKVSEEG
jgi:hypothetical protein